MLLDDGLLPEDFASRFEEDDAEYGDAWWYRRLKKYEDIGKRLLIVGLELGHLNVRQKLNPDVKVKGPLWSDLVLYFFHYFTFKLLIVIYLQYVFDYHHYYLVRFDQRARICSNRTQVPDLVAFRNGLLQNYESARCASKAVGAPFMHANYGIPVLYLLIALLLPLIYLVPQHYSNINAHVIRHLIQAPADMQQSIDSLIRDEVNALIVSSRTYNRVNIDHCLRSQNNRGTSGKYQIINEHKVLVERAKALASEGHLQPYNRRSGWRNVANVFIVLYVHLVPILLLSWLGWATAMAKFLDIKIESDFMDVLFCFEAYLYTGIGFVMITIYDMSVVVMCIDQTNTSSKLCSLIDTCIRENTRTIVDHLNSIQPPVAPASTNRLPRTTGKHTVSTTGQTSMDLIFERINVPLLHILLHNRIFVRQLQSHLEMMSLWATIALLLIVEPALVFRLLTTYLPDYEKFIMVFTLTFFLVVVNGGLVVVCRQHERCLDVYNRLQNLIAHATEMDRLAKSVADRGCYDQHLVQMLRRELSHPERLRDRFSAHILFVRTNITFPSLLKYNFWYGVWAISILMVDFELPNARDIFGGVWRFYSSADEQLSQVFANCINAR